MRVSGNSFSVSGSHHVLAERERGSREYQRTHFQSTDDITYSLSEGEGHESISELIFSQQTASRTR